MTAEQTSVLERPVEIVGGCFETPPRRNWYNREASRNVGGYSIELSVYESGMGRVELRENGPDKPTHTHYFTTADEARAEYARLETLLWARDWVRWVCGSLTTAGLIPAEFLAGVRAGELETLLVAADWQDEHDNPDAAILLRAAYHRISGNANVVVRAGRGKAIVLNPEKVTPKYPARPAVGDCRAAVVEEGKSVRIVKVEARATYDPAAGKWVQHPDRIESRTFGVGSMAEHGSYNLVYYGPVQSISAKTVVIDGGIHGVKRLTLGAFVEKNHDFDLAAAQKRNSEWSD